MNSSFYDLTYLFLVLTAIIILIENRIIRVVYLAGFQGFLLCFPVFQLNGFKDYHAWMLVSLVLVFKTLLTPYILIWSIKKSNLTEHTFPRLGFLATLFFLLLGLIAAVKISDALGELPSGVDRIEVIYVFLLIYLGIITFIVRQHWVALIIGFSIFENGMFLLTLVLHEGLPFGIEFGSFMDALLVIVSAIALKFREDVIKESGEVNKI